MRVTSAKLEVVFPTRRSHGDRRIRGQTRPGEAGAHNKPSAFSCRKSLRLLVRLSHISCRAAERSLGKPYQENLDDS
jgi:hypothetical protein